MTAMENAFAALISIAVILTGTLAIAEASLSSWGQTTQSWQGMEKRVTQIMRTDIEETGTVVNGMHLEIGLRNGGGISLKDFATWDVIVEYTDINSDYYVLWVPYTTAENPDSNQWTARDIEFNGSAETFEPGILNSGEEMTVKIRLPQTPKLGVPGRTTIATPNGVSTSVIWVR